jgi:urease accessory protein
MKIFLCLLAIFFSTSVFAHSGHTDTFLTAFMHPLLGWDHLLTMLVVGVMASLLPKSRGILLPIFFVVIFSLSAIAAMQFPLNENQSQILERLVLMGMIALPVVHFLLKRLQSWVILIAISLIGGLHGFTHGLEVNVHSNHVLFGLVLSTSLIHILGYVSGTYCKNKSEWILKGLTVGTGILGFIGLAQSF